MQLSVIIVSYNVRHYLWQCLDSVHRASEGLEMEVWVVDNASDDDSINYVRTSFPDVHYIQNTENVGFARANNQAIRQSTGKYVLLLNPDTILAEDTLRGAIRFMERHSRAGALGIHMINNNGSYAKESRRGLPTPRTAFYKVTGLCKLFPSNPTFGHYYMGHLSENANGQTEVISGAFMMLRRKTLDQIGLLDEDYFMYGEDIDLSYRVITSGWQCWYSPLQMLHYKGESTQKSSFRYVHSFYNAMLIFFRKHFARRYWLTWIIVEIMVVVMGIIAFIRNKLLSLWHLLFDHLRTHTPITFEPEQLCFIGSDEAWEMLQPICERAGINGMHINDIGDSPSGIFYLTFEVTADGKPYSNMLQLLQQAYTEGYKSHIGTFNPQSRVLILPNDIFC